MYKPKTFEEWKQKIIKEYDKDKNTHIRSQLQDMSDTLNLGWTWSDINYGFRYWKPQEVYKISERELDMIIEKIQEKKEDRDRLGFSFRI